MGSGAVSNGILNAGNTAMAGGSAGDVFSSFTRGAVSGAVIGGASYVAVAGIAAGANYLGSEYVRHNYNVVPGESRWLGNRLQCTHGEGFSWHNQGGLIRDNLARDAGRALNGFLHGAGRPLVPVGTLRRGTSTYGYGVNYAGQPASRVVNANAITDFQQSNGGNQTIHSIIGSSAIGRFNGSTSIFSFDGSSTPRGGIRRDHAFKYRRTNGAFSSSVQALDNTGLAPYLWFNIKVKEYISYGINVPWWAYVLGYR